MQEQDSNDNFDNVEECPVNKDSHERFHIPDKHINQPVDQIFSINWLFLVSQGTQSEEGRKKVAEEPHEYFSDSGEEGSCKKQ